MPTACHSIHVTNLNIGSIGGFKVWLFACRGTARGRPRVRDRVRDGPERWGGSCMAFSQGMRSAF